ncbi:uncharacterized protein ACNLHF_006908 [Anomaloglossus baeobatrachus]
MAISWGLVVRTSLLIVWFGLGIAMIVMGAIHKDDCPIMPYMPIFLLINGVIHLVLVVLLLLKSQLQKLCIAAEYICIISSFIWFVAGSSVLFKSINDDEKLYLCYPNLYTFAFAILVVDSLIYFGGFLLWYFYFRIRRYFYESLE